MGKSVISIRPCKTSDCRFVWRLRNEKTARQFAFNTAYIPYKRHIGWFRKKLKDNSSYIFIVLNNKRRIGEVRLDSDKKNSAEIGIHMLKKERGRGLGSAALKAASSHALRKMRLKKIVAHIKKDNIASVKAFENAEFTNTGIVRVKRQPAYRMVLK